MLHYYICYKSERLIGPLKRDEAFTQIFKLNGAVKGLYIQVVDSETGKIKKELPKRRDK